MTARTGGTTRTVAALVAAALLCALMVARFSSAGFSATTDSSSGWGSGTVALSDDDSGVALFNTAQNGLLDGGQTLTRCITVTYTGDLAAAVRLHASASGSLAPYLDLTVDEGASAPPDCTGFTTTTTAYTGTVAAFATSHPGYATGAAPWAATQNDTKTYRFTVTVQNVPAAQNVAATAAFTWEAHSGADAVVAAPAGDAAAAAVPVAFPADQAHPTAVNFSLAGASYEQWEEDAWVPWSGNDGTGSIWYQLTAPTSADIEINTFPGAGVPDAACNTVLQIFEGPVDHDYPTWVESNDDATEADPDQTCAGQSQVFLAVTAGQRYDINVQGYDAADMGAGRLTVRYVQPPVNDEPEGAITLAGLTSGSRTEALAFRGASAAPGETIANGKASVWARYTAPQNQYLLVTPSFAGSAEITVYTGGPSLGSLVPLPGVDGNNLTSGQTYYIQVAATPRASVSIWLGVEDPHPAGHDFADPLTLPALTAGQTGQTVSWDAPASFWPTWPETGEPGPVSPNGTIWFRYAASRTETVRFDTSPQADADGRMAQFDVFTGNRFSTFTTLGQGVNTAFSPGCDFCYALTMDVTAGTTYWVRVRPTNQGEHGYLTVTNVMPPSNDHIEHAITVPALNGSGASATLDWDTTLAGSDRTSGFANPYVDLWYAYTPDVNQDVSVDTFSGDLTAAPYAQSDVAIYAADGTTMLAEGDYADMSDPRQARFQQDRLSIHLTAGTTYYLAVGTYTGGRGPGRLTVTVQGS